MSRSSAVRLARRQLINSGFGAQLAAQAGKPGTVNGGSPKQQCSLLAEIANHVKDDDPDLIAAAWLLEQQGYSRGDGT